MDINYGDYLNELMSELNKAMSEITREREELFQLKRYGTLRDKVEFIIDRNTLAKLDYNFLCVLYWTTFDSAKKIEDVRAGRTPAESITRTRRFIMEERRQAEDATVDFIANNREDIIDALRYGRI